MELICPGFLGLMSHTDLTYISVLPTGISLLFMNTIMYIIVFVDIIEQYVLYN